MDTKEKQLTLRIKQLHIKEEHFGDVKKYY